MIIVRSIEDKKLLGHIKKKSKKKKINVFFNKKVDGKARYVSGKYYSNKMKESFIYRSSYELAYLEKLELDKSVIKYMYEPFEVSYIDFYKKSRKYIPDFLVLYEDGSIQISEIKPEAMLQDYDVKAKAKAVMDYIDKEYKGMPISYKFITEKTLFKSNLDYLKFLNKVKNR